VIFTLNREKIVGSGGTLQPTIRKFTICLYSLQANAVFSNKV
jgi:hypothetical protein